MTATPPRPLTNGFNPNGPSPATTPTSHSTTFDSTIEQDKALDAAIDTINKQCYYMNKSIDTNNLRDTLKYASSMCAELRTTRLSSTRYYELYNTIFNELSGFTQYIAGCDTRVTELYEVVQQISNIVPRLYLLICVAKIYIQQQPSLKVSILYDLIELCKGVQLPMNGLFLRYYLLQNLKVMLTAQAENGAAEHTDDDAAAANGDAAAPSEQTQLLDWLFTNLTEMCKLYYRCRAEQSNVLQLIGQNLVILSELNTDVQTYKSTIFPRFKTTLAGIDNKYSTLQSYLFESMLNVNSIEYLYATIDDIFALLNQLNHLPTINKLFDTLLRRFSMESTDMDSERLYDLFSTFIDTVSRNDKVSRLMVLHMYRNLLEFCVKNKKYDNVNTLYEKLAAFKQTDGAQPVLVDVCDMSVRTLPLEQLLQLHNFTSIYADTLNQQQQNTVFFNLIASLVQQKTVINQLSTVKPIFKLARSVELSSEQYIVLFCQLIQLIQADTVETYLQCIEVIEKACSKLLLQHYQLVETIVYQMLYKFNDTSNDSAALKKMVSPLFKLINVLSTKSCELCIKLLFAACLTFNRSPEFATEMYDYCAQVYVVFEDEMSDSKTQYTALFTIVSNLRQLTNLSQDNYGTLSNKAVQIATKLLRKQDCALAVVQCTYLYYTPTKAEFTDEKRVLQLLQRALKVTNEVTTNIRIELFITILAKYVYYYKQGVSTIQVKYINGIVDLINEQLRDSIRSSDSERAYDVYFANVCRYIQWQQSDKNVSGDRERWNDIVVGKPQSSADQLFDVE